MDVKQQLRCAALISWFDLTEDRETQNRITNELWCLRNDVDTTALSDLTYSNLTMKQLLDHVNSITHRSREEQSAFLLCTLREIS